MTVVIIRVMISRILLVRRHFGDNNAVSCFRALIAVVRKHLIIALMNFLCIEVNTHNCDVVDAVLVSSGLCQIIAA